MLYETDDRLLTEIYKNLELDDFLKIDESIVENYDWELFFEHRHLGICSLMVLESFTPAYKNKQISDGFEDVYEITIENDKKFTLVIDYSTPSKTKDTIETRILTLNHKEHTKTLGGLYEKYFKDLKDDENVAIIQFKDAQGRHNMTGDVGASSFQLFSSLKEGISDSFWTDDRMSKLRGFIFRVDNKEMRRLKLYEKLVQKFLRLEFPNIFIDTESENRVGMTLLVVTK